MKPRAALSWSGGKDSYLALHRSLSRFDVVAAVTMFNEDGSRSRSHGLRPDVVEAQVRRLGLTHVRGHGSWASYETGYREALQQVRSLGITHVIFGDIMYDANREFPERVCAAEGLVAVEPLWGEPTESLYREFIATDTDARIVTVRDGVISPAWLGRSLTLDLLAELEAIGVDACGEHGEYHTVIVDAPLFSSALRLIPGHTVCRDGCWALDLSLDERVMAEGLVDAAGV